MTTCPTCSGHRTITIIEPEKAKTVTYLNANGYPCCPADGGKPVIDWYETGRTVKRNYECHTCDGRGRINCVRCLDTGLVETCDGYGGYDSTSPTQCDCDAGRAVVAAHNARMDAERDLAYAEPF